MIQIITGTISDIHKISKCRRGALNTAKFVLGRSDMKKKKAGIILCAAAVLCLTAATAAIMISRQNPLAKGLMGLAEEITVLQGELGEHFFADVLNQVGNESVQAEYSLNIGGMEALKNITVGLDGELERDMEQELFRAETALSVANVELAEPSLFGTAKRLYVQVPSVWEGSVVLDADDIDGQWNTSAVRGQLAGLTGWDMEIDREIDVDLFKAFYADPYRFEDFLRKNGEKLKTLYKNMEVMKVEKARKRGLLSDAQAESLKNHMLEDEEGNRIRTICYLVILPEKEMKEIFGDVRGDIKLCVYLDADKRIVRIGTLPEEVLETEFWSGEAAVDLTGTEAVTDRVTLELTGQADLSEVCVALSGGAADFFAKPEITCRISMGKDKEAAGSYRVETDIALTEREKGRELSLEGSLRGERLEGGAKLSLEGFRAVLRSQDRTLCRVRGRAEFAPLAKAVESPSGKERRLAEMREPEGVLFLAECMKNIYENYSGYLKLLS